MATTSYGVNNALTVKLWARKLDAEALRETWASRFMGDDSNSIIQIRTETQKSAGDRITLGVRAQGQQSGVQGDGTLEGQEEALTTYSMNVLIDQLRFSFRSQGRMSQQRVPFEIRNECLAALRDLWADRLDYAFFNQAGGNTAETRTAWTGNQATIAPDTPSHYLNQHSTSSVQDQDLTSSDTFNLQMIDRCVERARTLSTRDGTGMPIRPVRINGGQYYVMVLHPYAVTDMRQNTNAGQWEDIQKALMTGGVTKDNPVFTGALGIYNGTILHADVRVPTGVNTGTSAAISTVRRNVFLGAQAVMCAFGQANRENKYTWVEELFDYENQLGVAAGMIFGMVKTRYNSQDYATIAASCYAASH